MRKLVPAVAAAALAAAALAGCGSHQVDITRPVSFLQSKVAPDGLRVSCPPKVSSGSQWDCTFTNAISRRSAKVRYEFFPNRSDAIRPVNETQAARTTDQLARSGPIGG